MTIVTITKAPTWTDMIIGLVKEQELNAPYDKMRSITSLISGTIKFKYPDRQFTTRKSETEVDGKVIDILVIKCIA